MTTRLLEPGRVDEPKLAQEYADVLSRVASERQPIILRRGGEDLVAVIPLDYLELLQDVVARDAAEDIASRLDWDRAVKESPPPQTWFDGDEPKPF